MPLASVNSPEFTVAKRVFGLDEGEKLKPYKDTKGLWTIGRGHLIGKRLEDLTLSPAVMDLIFQEDLMEAEQVALRIFGAEFLDRIRLARRIAITTLCFTLGYNRFKPFTDTIPAIQAESWELASRLVLATKWARDVDPASRKDAGRDDRIAYMLKTGELPPFYTQGG